MPMHHSKCHCKPLTPCERIQTAGAEDAALLKHCCILQAGAEWSKLCAALAQETRAQTHNNMQHSRRCGSPL